MSARQLRRLCMSKNVEVPVLTGNKSRFNFSDSVTTLDRVLVHAIFPCSLTGKTPEFRTPVPSYTLFQIATSQCFINLAGYGNEQFNVRLPLNVLKQKLNPFNGLYYLDGIFLKPRLISLRKSSLDIPSIQYAVFPADGLGVVLTFFYELYDPNKHQLNQYGELINDKDIEI